MHTRLKLLEEEEHRALRRIQETREKADKILQNREDSLILKKQVEERRKIDMKSRFKSVQRRNMATDDDKFINGSLMLARVSVYEI